MDPNNHPRAKFSCHKILILKHLKAVVLFIVTTEVLERFSPVSAAKFGVGLSRSHSYQIPHVIRNSGRRVDNQDWLALSLTWLSRWTRSIGTGW